MTGLGRKLAAEAIYRGLKNGETSFESYETAIEDSETGKELYEVRNTLGSRVDRAVKRAFKLEPEDFDVEFRRWLRKKYLPKLVQTGEPSDFGRIFRNNAVLSAMGVPQYAAIMGNCVAGGAYLPVLCDKIRYHRDPYFTARLLPALVRSTEQRRDRGAVHLLGRRRSPGDPRAVRRLRQHAELGADRQEHRVRRHPSLRPSLGSTEGSRTPLPDRSVAPGSCCRCMKRVAVGASCAAAGWQRLPTRFGWIETHDGGA